MWRKRCSPESRWLSHLNSLKRKQLTKNIKIIRELLDELEWQSVLTTRWSEQQWCAYLAGELRLAAHLLCEARALLAEFSLQRGAAHSTLERANRKQQSRQRLCCFDKYAVTTRAPHGCEDALKRISHNFRFRIESNIKRAR